MNEHEHQAEKRMDTVIPGMKQMYARLQDICNNLEDADSMLEYFVTGPKAERKDQVKMEDSPGFYMAQMSEVVERISRKTNNICKNTTLVVGS